MGTTVGYRGGYGGAGAHPHTRGDDVRRPAARSSLRGSPPHAWGRPRRRHGAEHPARLTPTRVGTTTIHSSSPFAIKAHPHTRGDDGDWYAFADPSRISPPHAWGRRYLMAVARELGRLTPTRVGTTIARHLVVLVPRAHPHTRGDDATEKAFIFRAPGSPPHAWGRRSSSGVSSSGGRLTPTRVGTTSDPRTRTSPSRAHPHTRGDDRSGRGTCMYRLGSPPHAWGRP